MDLVDFVATLAAFGLSSWSNQEGPCPLNDSGSSFIRIAMTRVDGRLVLWHIVLTSS